MEKQVIEKLKLSFDDIVHTTEEELEYCCRRFSDILNGAVLMKL